MIRLRRDDILDALFAAFVAGLILFAFAAFAWSQPPGAPPGYFEFAQLASNQAEYTGLQTIHDGIGTSYQAALKRWQAQPQNTLQSLIGGATLNYADTVWTIGSFYSSWGYLHMLNEETAFDDGDLETADTEGAAAQQFFQVAGQCYTLAQNLLEAFGP